MSSIHPSAVVEKGAELGEDVVVEAFCYVGGMVRLGDNCRLRHHSTVDGNVCMGQDNEVFPYALIGGKTHDLKYEGGAPGLRIANHNVFREYVTVHPATQSGDETIVGSNNLLLAYSHVAHDCRIGDHLIMSSHAALGGHVEVGDHVNVGWGVGVHQFCRLGSHCMAAACSKVVQDVPPFVLAEGTPAEGRSINKIGMERADFPASSIAAAKKVFKILYKQGLNRSQALRELESLPELEGSVTREIVAFLKRDGRGLA
ncbi:MAG: acyl-[acyl-carrier-protein]--UDP-N-acetylglucosamine O-acyltransferase [Opitutae bacterium]|jgi:UDP-N-acetylglucosamine acyltransferase|nr:acyl-[acyl-carrier-protein]--UDP-N-acetylglucosamine O-acyltransferase [Opitutae bacterium]|tara:strand:+ start:2300 stop:3073 length:774 start_codon:yes stop_codon:yes gene_type:complete